MTRLLLLTALLFTVTGVARSQDGPDPESVARLVDALKRDPRGPFDAIRWFCPDGRVIAPDERCDTPGGVQHGRLRPDVRALADRYGIWIGQVLAGVPPVDFLDVERGFSRARQYQMDRFLQRSDDGWIWRRARFYRGAVQVEDEERAANDMLRALLDQDSVVRNHFLGVRDLVRDLPGGRVSGRLDRIRADAATMAADYPAFSDLRVKLHGQPDSTDRDRVRQFGGIHRTRMPASTLAVFDRLQEDLDAEYGRTPLRMVLDLLGGNPSTVERELITPVSRALQDEQTDVAIDRLADALFALRARIEAGASAERLRLLRTSVLMEALLFRVASDAQPPSLARKLARMEALARAAAGAGYVERWEFEGVAPSIRSPGRTQTAITVNELRHLMEGYRRVVEWGVGSIQAVYGETVERYSPFEPLAAAFTDDRLRSSILLHLGRYVAELSDRIAVETGGMARLLDVPGAGTARGVNAGFAVGELVVVPGSPADVAFDPDRIYVLASPPAELKPVAGILSVSEGNVVSHVQLLARNLGIPNAIVTPEHVRRLAPYSGTQVFLAVSPGGVVRLVDVGDMTDEERALVTERKRSDERIRVPTDRLALAHRTLTDLSELRAGDSGRICGPKAANLGQLGALFPGRVAPGFIVPFGEFRRHMDQAMPGSPGTYWDYLATTFRGADALRAGGRAAADVDAHVLGRLDTLRRAIEVMPLSEDFVRRLRERFRSVFGSATGTVPVFVRSDTNMEDLADFTGAGLNLTVPNVVPEADILAAVRRVWASPYRERGYLWRQRYLLNPEDVYPSLLVLRSVDADLSGVLITKGIGDGDATSSTVAVNRGVGGAVDGQAAETWLLPGSGADRLVAPARERWARRLPRSGGVDRERVSFERPILDPAARDSVRTLAAAIRNRLPGSPGIESDGPFDVEFGLLDGRLVLFQVRPFVDNRNAASEAYLSGLDARIGTANRLIPLRNPGAR